MSEQTPSIEQHDARPEEQTAPEAAPTAAAPAAAPAPPTPRPAVPGPAAPSPAVPSPAALAGLHAPGGHRASEFGRVDDDGTVFVRTPEGEREVGSYPGATARRGTGLLRPQVRRARWRRPTCSQQRLTQHRRVRQGGRRRRWPSCASTSTTARVVGDLAALAGQGRGASTAALAGQAATEDAEHRAAARAGPRPSARRSSPRPSRSPASPSTRSSGRPAARGCAPCSTSGRRSSAAAPSSTARPRRRCGSGSATPATAFDKARRVHFAQLETQPGRGQGRQGGAGRRGRGAGDQHRLGPDGRGVQAADGPVACRRPGLARRRRRPVGALQAAQDTFFAAKDEVVGRRGRGVPGQPRGQGGAARRGRGAAAGHRPRGRQGVAARHPGPWEAAGKVPARRPRAGREGGCAGSSRPSARPTRQRWKRTNPEVAARAQSAGRPARGRRRRPARPTSPRPRPPATTARSPRPARPSRPASSGSTRPAPALDEFSG